MSFILLLTHQISKKFIIEEDAELMDKRLIRKINSLTTQDIRNLIYAQFLPVYSKLITKCKKK